MTAAIQTLREKAVLVGIVLTCGGAGGGLTATAIGISENSTITSTELRVIRESLLAEIRLANQQMGQISSRVEDHENRLRTLERIQVERK